MSLQERIQTDLTTAMKARDRERIAALRMALASLQNAAVAANRGPQGALSDDEVQAVLATEVKRRREAETAFRDGGRTERADAEAAEAAIYAAYLPEQLDEDELAAIVAAIVEELGAASMKDMGAVMKAVMARVQGQADGSRVSAMVKQRLSG